MTWGFHGDDAIFAAAAVAADAIVEFFNLLILISQPKRWKQVNEFPNRCTHTNALHLKPLWSGEKWALSGRGRTAYQYKWMRWHNLGGSKLFGMLYHYSISRRIVYCEQSLNFVQNILSESDVRLDLGNQNVSFPVAFFLIRVGATQSVCGTKLIVLRTTRDKRDSTLSISAYFLSQTIFIMETLKHDPLSNLHGKMFVRACVFVVSVVRLSFLSFNFIPQTMRNNERRCLN